MTSATSASSLSQPWHAGLTPSHWRVLAASFLGWVFDGYEAYALVVALPSALRALLRPEQLRAAPVWAGVAISVTLLGWGIGGLVGGTLSDYVAWVFPILAGTMIQKFGGIPRAAMTLGLIYVLGLVVPWFVPETRGKPLPR